MACSQSDSPSSQDTTNNDTSNDTSNDDDGGSGNDDGTANDTCSGGVFEGTIGITSQEALNEFGANGYTEIVGSLTVSYCNDLSPLACLQKIDQLHIKNNDITSLHGLEQLEEVSYFFSIEDCDLLQNMEGLDSFTKAKRFVVYQNDGLTNLQGLSSFESVSELVIRGNQNLLNFQGLEQLKYVIYESNSSRIEIWENDNLVDISGMNGLTGELSYLDISRCPSLTEFGSFDLIETLNETIYLNDLDALVTFDAFPNLTTGFGILIQACDNLESIRFDSLQELGLMKLQENDALWDLQGLSSLTSFTYGSPKFTSLTIAGNDALQSLAGFENLAYAASKVTINPNDALSLTDVCALQLLVDNYLEDGVDPVNENYIYIRNNCSFGEELLNDFSNLCDCN